MQISQIDSLRQLTASGNRAGLSTRHTSGRCHTFETLDGRLLMAVDLANLPLLPAPSAELGPTVRDATHIENATGTLEVVNSTDNRADVRTSRDGIIVESPPSRPQAAPETGLAERLTRVEAFMSDLGIATLSDLGTLRIQSPSGFAESALTQGVYVTRSHDAPQVTPAGDWHEAPSGLAGLIAVDGNGAASVAGQTIRYEGTDVVDSAVILAKEVVFDAAHLQLTRNVSELIIVAETVRSINGSVIRWQDSDTNADVHPTLASAPNGQGYNPTVADADATFARRNGDDGQDGAEGRSGNVGLDAPSVYFFLRDLTAVSVEAGSDISLPAIDVSGQNGGPGQTGQAGGDGGDGAKGRTARSGTFGCTSGPGYGGHGGDGGLGGDGGAGGEGGEGGRVGVYFVHADTGLDHHSVAFDTAGGQGGSGGPGRPGGDGGQGGRAGDPKGYCQARPGRHGDDGHDGTSGADGAQGADGLPGNVIFQPVPLTTWEAAFTRPYLVTAGDVHVGQTMVLGTANITGPATLYLKDELSGASMAFAVEESGNGDYQWDVPLQMTASWYTIRLQRAHDAAITNSYRVEIRPTLLTIEFADEFDARSGGTAQIVGYGLRQDAEVMIEGVRVQPIGMVDEPSGLDRLSFAIPVLPTYDDKFVRQEANTERSLYLDQPFPLSDSDAVTFQTKQNVGLTFRPSVNGFEFSNADMFDAAQKHVTQHGAVRGITGYAEDLFEETETWRLFKETYGAAEVNGLGGRVSPMNWINYGIWYFSGWANPQSSGTCAGLSTVALDQYFNEYDTQQGREIDDVLRTTIITHGRQISDELIGLQIAETLIDHFSPSVGGPSMTELTLQYITNFYQHGSQILSGFAPVLSLVPNSEIYRQVLVDGLNLIGETVNVFDSISPGESWEDFKTSWREMGDMMASAHVITPYQVVFDHPTDALPSRIYVYDSNDPGNDSLYLTIETVNGQVKFQYPGKDYATDQGWMLGVIPARLLAGDVDLLIDGDVVPFGLSDVGDAYKLLDHVLAGSRFLSVPSSAVGGVNLGNAASAADIDALFAAVETRDSSERFDLNKDGQVTEEDVTYLVKEVLKTNFGDANLDGFFNSADLIQVFQAGEYEDTVRGNSRWSSGDWNGDGEFDSSDLVLALQDQAFLTNAISA